MAFFTSAVTSYFLFGENGAVVTEKTKTTKENVVSIEKERKPSSISELVSPDKVTNFKNQMKTLPLTDDFKKIKEKVGTDPIMVNIFEALHANELEKNYPDAKVVREEAYETAKLSSKESLDKIQNLLRSLLPHEQSVNKMRLLDLAANLDGVDEEVNALAIEVMNQNVPDKRPDPKTAHTREEENAAYSTTFEMMVPVMAHAVAMSKSQEADTGLSVTLDGIANQKEPYIQEKMYSNFLAKFPDMKPEIDNELASLQIQFNSDDSEQRLPASKEEADPSEEVPQEEREVEFIKEHNEDIVQ